MDRCPACNSEWMNREPLPPGLRFASSLTAWRPYTCGLCGWRGWRESADVETDWPPELHDVQGRAAAAVGRLVGARGPALRRAVRWVGPAFAVGLLVGALLFAGGEPEAPPPDTASATLEAPEPARPQEPAVQVSAPDVTARTIPDPQVAPAAKEVAAIVRPADPASADDGAAAAATTRVPRPAVPARSAGAPASAARQAQMADLPRYRGSLAIASDPSGATVYVDGRAVGSTPIVLRNLAAGSRVVRVESDGYERWSAAARVVADRETRVSATLQRGSER